MIATVDPITPSRPNNPPIQRYTRNENLGLNGRMINSGISPDTDNSSVLSNISDEIARDREEELMRMSLEIQDMESAERAREDELSRISIDIAPEGKNVVLEEPGLSGDTRLSASRNDLGGVGDSSSVVVEEPGTASFSCAEVTNRCTEVTKKYLHWRTYNNPCGLFFLTSSCCIIPLGLGTTLMFVSKEVGPAIACITWGSAGCVGMSACFFHKIVKACDPGDGSWSRGGIVYGHSY